MNKLFEQSFLDYLYKFISYSNLSIEKENLKEILLSRGIIFEDDYGKYDINYLSDEAYKFIDDNYLNNIKNYKLIEQYTNILIKRYDGIISNQIEIIIKHTFYCLFLDKLIINPNGELTPNALVAKNANILDKYISFRFN